MDDNKFQREVLDRLIRLETKLDQQDYVAVKEKSDEAYTLSKQNEKKIAEIEERNKWLVRTIGGAIIVGFIGIIILYVKIGLGVE
jgi:hypothetical protein